jgi:hypothetical protein
MRVSFIRSIIANKKPDYEIAVIWFDKTDAENIADDDLSPAEWEKIVKEFSASKHLNQIADEFMDELVFKAINKRDNKNAN